ncbi:unnamed protein product [Closterium sp. Yama58-4]|nr:unnamed protein product [Closterium sp. Yama58-4]
MFRTATRVATKATASAAATTAAASASGVGLSTAFAEPALQSDASVPFGYNGSLRPLDGSWEEIPKPASPTLPAFPQPAESASASVSGSARAARQRASARVISLAPPSREETDAAWAEVVSTMMAPPRASHSALASPVASGGTARASLTASIAGASASRAGEEEGMAESTWESDWGSEWGSKSATAWDSMGDDAAASMAASERALQVARASASDAAWQHIAGGALAATQGVTARMQQRGGNQAHQQQYHQQYQQQIQQYQQNPIAMLLAQVEADREAVATVRSLASSPGVFMAIVNDPVMQEFIRSRGGVHMPGVNSITEVTEHLVPGQQHQPLQSAIDARGAGSAGGVADAGAAGGSATGASGGSSASGLAGLMTVVCFRPPPLLSNIPSSTVASTPLPLPPFSIDTLHSTRLPLSAVAPPSTSLVFHCRVTSTISYAASISSPSVPTTISHASRSALALRKPHVEISSSVLTARHNAAAITRHPSLSSVKRGGLQLLPTRCEAASSPPPGGPAGGGGGSGGASDSLKRAAREFFSANQGHHRDHHQGVHLPASSSSTTPHSAATPSAAPMDSQVEDAVSSAYRKKVVKEGRTSRGSSAGITSGSSYLVRDEDLAWSALIGRLANGQSAGGTKDGDNRGLAAAVLDAAALLPEIAALRVDASAAPADRLPLLRIDSSAGAAGMASAATTTASAATATAGPAVVKAALINGKSSKSNAVAPNSVIEQSSLSKLEAASAGDSDAAGRTGGLDAVQTKQQQGVGGEQQGLGIIPFLKGKHILITGATGFLAKALVEKILREQPDVGQLYLLIQPRGDTTAHQRLTSQVIPSAIFAHLKQRHGEGYEAFMSSKLTAVDGNIGEEHLGLSAVTSAALADKVDLIINSAATTDFDARYDVALNINTLGPRRLLAFAKQCHHLQLLLHVSTAYVNGKRKGQAMERPFAPGDTIAAEMLAQAAHSPAAAAAAAAAAGIPALDVDGEVTFAHKERAEVEAAAVARGASKDEVVAAVNGHMSALGRARAQVFGWQDAYVLSKAMGEMTLGDQRGGAQGEEEEGGAGVVPVVVVRPSIVESALCEPMAGWMEGMRMADPILMAYGKGAMAGFLADGVADIIPVDFVVNAILAVAAGNAKLPPQAPDGVTVSSTTTIAASASGYCLPRVYHVTTSVANPLHVNTIADAATDHFAAKPMKQKDGSPISVAPARVFKFPVLFLLDLWIRYQLPMLLMKLFPKKGASTARRTMIMMKTIESLMHFAKIYSPYTFYEARFDSSNTEELFAKMSLDEQQKFNFNVRNINWHNYMCNVHIPGLRKFEIQIIRAHSSSCDSTVCGLCSSARLFWLLPERRAPELDFDKRYAQSCSSFGINPPLDILSALASPSHRISEDGSPQLAVELPLAHLSDAVAVTLGEFLATACPELHIVDVSSADAVPTVSGHGILFLLRAVGPHLQHANLSNIPLGREAFRDLFQRGLNARSLCFSFCRVRKLDFVGAFPRLRSLVLDHNPAITCLPDGCFSNAPSLTSLSLCATGISNLWTTVAALAKLPLLRQLRFQRCMCCRGDTSACAELAAGLAGDPAEADEGARREVARADGGAGNADDGGAGVGGGGGDVVEVRAWLGQEEVQEGMAMDEVMRDWEAEGQTPGDRGDAQALAFAAEQVGVGFGGPGDAELGMVGDADMRNAGGEGEERGEEDEMSDEDVSEECSEEEEESDEDEEERERRDGEFRHAGMPWQHVLSREPRGLRQGGGVQENAAEAATAGNNGGATGAHTEGPVPRAVPLGPSPRMRGGRLQQHQPLFRPVRAARTAAAVPGAGEAQGTGVLAAHPVVLTAAARGAREHTSVGTAAAAAVRAETVAGAAGLVGAGGDMAGGLRARELDLMSYLMEDAPRRLRGRETGATATAPNNQRAGVARAGHAVAANGAGAARNDNRASEGPHAAAPNLLQHSSPICHVPHYRAFVLSSLPHLDVLDNMAVREGERAQAAGECKSSFEPLPYGLGSIGNVVHLLRRREIRAPLRALASVAARPLPTQQSVSKENLPPVGVATGTAVAGAAVAAAAAATPVLASDTSSAGCVTGSTGGPAGDTATEEPVGGQQRQQETVAGVLGSGRGDGADSERVGQTDMEYTSHDGGGDENGDGDDGDEDDSGDGYDDDAGKGKAPVEEQEPEPPSARLWRATAGAKGGSVEGYRRALGANRVGCTSWPASRAMTCPLRNAGLDAPRMSSSLRPRQFEYHPTEPHLMVLGTLHGDVVVLNHESDRLVGHVQSVGAPHSILGLCWLNKHPNRLIGGCDNGSIQLYDVDRMRACLVAAIGRSAAAAASSTGASSSGTASSNGSSVGGGSAGALTGSGGRTAATAAAAAVAAVAPADMTTPPAVLAAPAAGVVRAGGPVSGSPLGLGGSASRGSPVTPARLRHPAIHTYDEFEQLTSVHVNCTDDLFLASGYSNHVGLYDVHTGRRLQTLHNLHGEHINVLKFAHHSPHVFATSSFDRHVKLWDARQRISSSSSGGGFGGLFAQGRESVRPIYSVRSDRGNVMVCFSPDDQFLLSSAVDNEVRQHVAVDGRLQQRFEIAALGSAHNYTRSYYMNGRDYIVSGSCEENVVRICCAKTGRRLRDIPLEGKGGKSSLYVQSLRGDPFRDFHLSVLVAYSQPNSPSDIVKVNLVAGPPHRKGLDSDFQTQPLASVGA